MNKIKPFAAHPLLCLTCRKVMGMIYGRFEDSGTCSRKCNDEYEAKEKADLEAFLRLNKEKRE